jgi:glycerophosphoryl diester phosphodiesterase
MKHHVKIFAHRGASGHALENSYKAFDKAIEMNADGIEIDLQCSKDGQLFVFHDLHLRRLAGVNRFFYDCLAEEIAEFKIGKPFLRRFMNIRIPSVEAFMVWLSKNPVSVNVELKESLLKHKDHLITWLIDLELPKGSHFSSFFPELLQIVKQVRPEYEVAILVTKKFKWDELKSMDEFDVVHANKKYYKRLYLNYASEAKKPLRFYGINGDEPFLKHPHPIVVGWITDYPKKVADFISKK